MVYPVSGGFVTSCIEEMALWYWSPNREGCYKSFAVFKCYFLYFQSASIVVNNLLEVSSSWNELDMGVKKSIASTLLEALEQSGWLLASAHKSTFTFHKALHNLSKFCILKIYVFFWALKKLQGVSNALMWCSKWENWLCTSYLKFCKFFTCYISSFII